jgi:hypothetical protein
VRRPAGPPLRLAPAPRRLALEEERVRRALEQAVEVQLLVPEADGGLAFRHALVRDAVVSLLLAPTRVALARRAASAVGGRRPLLAADLWLAAGDPGRRRRRLVDAGRRATGRRRADDGRAAAPVRPCAAGATMQVRIAPPRR